MNAFYCSPWAETPTGGNNAVWLGPSGRLGECPNKAFEARIMSDMVMSWIGKPPIRQFPKARGGFGSGIRQLVQE